MYYIGSKESPIILPQLDDRLLHIINKSRFYHFQVRGTETRGYFVSNTNFATFEHRLVMQMSNLSISNYLDKIL